MSLLETLLTEGWRDPRDVYIALRSDGQRTGMQSDYRNDRPVSRSDGQQSEPQRHDSHSHHQWKSRLRFDGDYVSISGVKIQSGNKLDLYFLRTFTITVAGPATFTYTMLGVPSSSSAAPLEGASIQCWREREQFDALMRSIPANAVVHLGPGVFETKGFASSIAGGWTARSGQHIAGSGMGLTTLRIVGAAGPYSHYGVIAAVEYLDGFDASDLTVDCNVEGQLHPNAVCAAINIHSGGRHVRIRRVRAINFGSRAPVDTYIENFVFYVSVPTTDTPQALIAQGEDGHDCVLEDCIAERPTPNSITNSTILLIGGGERGDALAYFARGCAIRHCWVDTRHVCGPVVEIDSIAYAGGLATVTKWPHGRSAPGNILIEAAVNNGAPAIPITVC